MLRALVSEQVEVTDAMVRAEYDLHFGERFRVRLITASTMADAQRALDAVRGGRSFADVAATMSTDAASAQRGGLLDAISPHDPTYPLALRRVLSDLEVGDLSPVIPIDASCAVMQMVERLAASTTSIDRVRGDLEQTVRLGQERLLMDNLARDLLTSAEIVVLDPALHDGWESRNGRR
jgi:parvulin-like peptidyl-prolyl isomerase